jgi:hypothetical protein
VLAARRFTVLRVARRRAQETAARTLAVMNPKDPSRPADPLGGFVLAAAAPDSTVGAPMR